MQGITVYGAPHLNVTGLSEQTRRAVLPGHFLMPGYGCALKLKGLGQVGLHGLNAHMAMEEFAVRGRRAVTSLKDEDFANVIGADWKQCDRYQLDTLEGPSGGLLHPKLNKHRVNLVDVSNNHLMDISVLSKANGYDALHTIMARKNLLSRISLNLPKLVELNLAYNLLKTMPSLGLLPSLEVLILSHNQLSGSLENLKSAMRIKRLDLAYNEFDWTPSQLSQALNAMSHLRSLQNLRLYHNKFVACFKEYQIYVVSRLKSLQKLDDCIISMDMRDEIESTNLLALDVYDVAFKKRQEELARRRNNAGVGPALGAGVGKLKLIMESLEEILEESSALAARIAVVRENAALRAQSSDNEGFNVEQAFWDGMDNGGSDKEMEITVSYILELITAVMERHDTARNNLVDTLGFLSCVVSHGLGQRCLDLLRRMMLSSDHCREEAARGVKTIVVPTVLAFGEANINSEITKSMLLALVNLVQEKQIREEVCDILEELLPLLLNWFLMEEYLTEDGAHIVKLLASITGPKEYAQTAASPELAARTITHLENKALFDNMRLRSTWIDVLQITQNIVTYGSQEIVDMFYKAAIHSKVVARLRQVLTATKGRHNDLPLPARTIACICQFVSAMMTRSNASLQECCDPICFQDVLCQLLRSHLVDPLILEAVTKTLRTMLEDPKVYKKQAIKVVEDLRKVTPLLQFLGGKKYPDLYKMALKYSEDDHHEAPPFAELENDLVTNAMIGIVVLVEFFAAEDESIENDQARELVNDAMNTQGRETILLKLLVIPCDDLKLCLQMGQIEPDEMGAIVKCLSDVKNIGEGRTEEMLALVVRQLQRLLLAPGDTGPDFQQGFAERAVAECSEILMANSARSTDRESDELEKLELSLAIVNFYFSCSGIPSLRSCLRNPTIDALFPRIMKFEEELHSPLAADVMLEQTWLGRSLENLLQCFQGEKVLVRDKKASAAMSVLGAKAFMQHKLSKVPNGHRTPPRGTLTT
ncbi:inlI [Symbiodinium pilosum]|uniref:InlI protein n=1 Tax=Symbiodinium pilosum TaxID=2952 RepID=A0A812M0H9_SYMPI|nr:inlI [Symbiodinium pilosum]